MQISRIANIQQFDQLKTDWEAVYSADPHAHIFVSWMWLRGWLDITPFTWIVLAMRPDEASPYVAFFPLNLRFLRVSKFSLIRELRMGGKPLGGYTGFVCLPEYEEKAMGIFAAYVQQQLGWDSFQMEHVLDSRLDLFLKCFPPEKFDIRQVSRSPSTYIPLPDTFDQYLQDCLNIKTRQNLTRHTRQVENHRAIRAIHVQEDNLASQITAAQMLSQLRWGPRPEHILNWESSMLRYCFEHNCLWLATLWDGITPVSARVALVDRKKKTVYDFFTGYDAKYARLSPGTVVLGYNIRDAIENKFHVYDFLMGGDDYKFALGARRRNDVVTMVVARKSLRSTVANVGLNLARQLRDLLRKMDR